MATTVAQPKRTALQGLAHTLSRLDGWMLLSFILLVVMGLLSLYSIDHSSNTDFFKKQLLRICVGAVPFVVFLMVRPSRWQAFAKPLYVLNLVLLGLVFLIGVRRNDALRWFEVGPIDVQPSELTKLFIVLTLSTFFATRMKEVRTLKTFLLSFLHVAIPMALIYKQPHLGSTLVIGLIWLTIAWIAGCRMRHIVLSVIGGLGVLTALFFIPGGLSDYQKSRVLGLIFPDKQSSGYQVHRGLVAIGSGELGGKGYLKGEQKSLRFIPEQESDFVFTVIGEEAGLMGGVIVLVLFGILLFRTWMIVYLGQDPYHRLVAAGIFAIFAAHIVANLGMVLQVLPVVGLWLPFMSYGGTAIWLCMACIALLLNIRGQEDVGEF